MIDVPLAANAAARARQLRARPGGDGRACRTGCFASRPQLTIVATSREPLRVAGRGRLPRPVARHSRARIGRSRRSSSSSTSPSRCSSIARPPPRRASRSTPRTRRTWRASASASTGCRLRSSSPRDGSACSARRRSPSGSTTASACLRIGKPRRADPAADADRDAAVEPRSAGAGRAGPVPPACDLRRRLRARGRRGGLCRRRARSGRGRRRAGAPRREVARHRRGGTAGNGATACSRRFACTHASGSPRPPKAPSLADRHAGWALALAEREHGSPRLDRETPNLRAALDTLLEHAPHDALRLCVALLPFWLRRIELDEARRRFAVALEACPERTTLGAEALLAAAAIDFRSGTPVGRHAARRAKPRRRVRDRRRAPRMAGAAVSRRVRDRRRCGRGGTAVARAGARAGTQRAIRGGRGDQHPLARRRGLDRRRPAADR